MMLRELDLWISVCCLVCLVAAGQSINCPDKCGDIEIKFPFGTAQGCGDPEHQLSCNGPYNLTVKQGEISVNVMSINYTLGSMIINTTANPLYYKDKCESLVLSSDAYDLSEEEIFVCAFTNVQATSQELFPEIVQGPQTGCFFKKGIGISLPWLVQLPGLVFQCYNYTKNNGADGINPPAALTYASVPWKVRPDWKEACFRCSNTGENICGYNMSNNDSFECYRAAPAGAPAPGELQGALSRASPRSRNTVIGAVAGASGGALLLLLCLGGCIIFRRRQAVERRRYILDGPDSANKKALDSSMGSSKYLSSSGSYDGHVHQNVYTSPGNTRFTLRELEEATGNFSEELGDGGFGTVYKGKLLDGRLIAVKKLNPWNAQGKSQFHNEVNILSQVTHPHLVRLYGCCSEAREHLLVYEFIANGTLADHIHDSRAGFMDWDKRLTVALETAEALAWLHNNVSPPIFHRDVKTTNILIDDGYHAKVGDFGLSRLVPSLDLTHISTAPQGTPGYLDPDYHQSYQLTDKSDVYSFGVVLMEIVSSLRAVDMSRDRKEINLAALAVSRIQCGQLEKLVDPKLGAEYDPVRWRMVEGVAELSFGCLAVEKDDRPCMLTVSQRLRQIYEEGKREYLEQMKAMSRGGSINSSKMMGSRGFVNVPQESPTSVQNMWSSIHTSPNDSNSSL